jgi:ubiquinone/menaquinone biosynthesis C-methylase UbiE
MGVAAHLGIELAEYDARIRTFIPDYEEMLDVAAAAVPDRARTIVDLGTGTGALAARCLERVKRARRVGIDADPGMLTLAGRRLGDRATLLQGSFLRVDVPRCDVVVASFALHHVRTIPAKARLYVRLRRAVRRGGRLIIVDCQPSRRASIAAAQRQAWRAHLGRAYPSGEARRLLRAWGREDTYVPLDSEVALLRRAGFAVDLLWRKGAFAVLLAE